MQPRFPYCSRLDCSSSITFTFSTMASCTAFSFCHWSLLAISPLYCLVVLPLRCFCVSSTSTCTSRPLTLFISCVPTAWKIVHQCPTSVSASSVASSSEPASSWFSLQLLVLLPSGVNLSRSSDASSLSQEGYVMLTGHPTYGLCTRSPIDS